MLDATQWELVIGTAVIIGAPLVTWGLGKVPQTRAWMRRMAVEGYAYLDKVKADVPAAGMEAWQAAYDGLDAVIQALADDEITASELRHMGKHAAELVLAVKKLIV